jgi:hypothetical protein
MFDLVWRKVATVNYWQDASLLAVGDIRGLLTAIPPVVGRLRRLEHPGAQPCANKKSGNSTKAQNDVPHTTIEPHEELICKRPVYGVFEPA